MANTFLSKKGHPTPIKLGPDEEIVLTFFSCKVTSLVPLRAVAKKVNAALLALQSSDLKSADQGKQTTMRHGKDDIVQVIMDPVDIDRIESFRLHREKAVSDLIDILFDDEIRSTVTKLIVESLREECPEDLKDPAAFQDNVSGETFAQMAWAMLKANARVFGPLELMVTRLKEIVTAKLAALAKGVEEANAPPPPVAS